MQNFRKFSLFFVIFTVFSVQNKLLSSMPPDAIEREFFSLGAGGKYGRVRVPYDSCTRREQAFSAKVMVDIESARERFLPGRDIKPGQDQASNVACFAFGFYDESGACLTGEDPVFFGNRLMKELQDKKTDLETGLSGHLQACENAWKSLLQAEKENLKKALHSPHFFFSGRLDRKLADGSQDSTTLYEYPVEIDEIKEFLSKYDAIRSKLAKLEKQSELVKQRQKFSADYFVEVFNEWPSPLEILWREALQRRTKFIEKQDAALIHPRNARAWVLRRSGFDRVQGVKELGEFAFVHSEQMALARLHTELKSFLEQAAFAFDLDRSRISKCKIYIFTRNTICARCAISCLADFEMEKGIFQTIQGFIKEGRPAGTMIERPEVFVVSKIGCETQEVEDGHRHYDYDLESQNTETKQWLLARLHLFLQQVVIPKELSFGIPRDLVDEIEEKERLLERTRKRLIKAQEKLEKWGFKKDKEEAYLAKVSDELKSCYLGC